MIVVHDTTFSTTFDSNNTQTQTFTLFLFSFYLEVRETWNLEDFWVDGMESGTHIFSVCGWLLSWNNLRISGVLLWSVIKEKEWYFDKKTKKKKRIFYIHVVAVCTEEARARLSRWPELHSHFRLISVLFPNPNKLASYTLYFQTWKRILKNELYFNLSHNSSANH